MSAMAKAQKKKGDQFVKDAETLLAKKSWFSSSKAQNQEDAAETFEKAANAYKVGGLNQEAGDSYVKAAEIYRDKYGNTRSLHSSNPFLNNNSESVFVDFHRSLHMH